MTKKFIIFGAQGGHSKYAENSNRPYTINGLLQNVDQSACCVYCGKLVLRQNTFVFLSNDARVITKEEANGMDDLGLYPVGSDCAKLARRAGHKLYNWDCQEV